MITTVTLNAAIDKTYYLDHFELSKVSRIKRVHSIPGGKGINVARVVKQLGGEVIATGFIGGKNGDFIAGNLQKQGISHDFVRVEEESRLCLNIIDQSKNSSTELLEPGPSISEKSIEEIKNKVQKLSQQSEIVVFSGSLPVGVPDNFYDELILIAKSEGAKVFLDTSGNALFKGIASNPFLIKPNQYEMMDILGHEFDPKNDLMSIHRLMDQGISCVVVSLGEAGSIAGYKDSIYLLKTPKINIVNTVGCGDAFLAGMAISFSQGHDIRSCLRFASAVATASALTMEAGNIRKNDLNQLLSQVEITSVRS